MIVIGARRLIRSFSMKRSQKLEMCLDSGRNTNLPPFPCQPCRCCVFRACQGRCDIRTFQHNVLRLRVCRTPHAPARHMPAKDPCGTTYGQPRQPMVHIHSRGRGGCQVASTASTSGRARRQGVEVLCFGDVSRYALSYRYIEKGTDHDLEACCTSSSGQSWRADYRPYTHCR